MPSGIAGASSESEPFLNSQHYESDIELGERHRAFPNEAGEESGDHADKINSTLRSSAHERGSNRHVDHGSTPGIFGYHIWKPFLFLGGRTIRKDGRSCLARSTHQNRESNRSCRVLKSIFRLFTYFLMFLGILQFLALVLGIFAAVFPGHIELLYQNGDGRDGFSHWPTDFTADILPVKCHSHNDYWRKIPLFSALDAGCTGVEADVWLYEDELFVGHTESSLTPNRTFKSLYINPLGDVLGKQNPVTKFQPVLKTPPNGVFDTDAEQQLVLLVDFKTNGDALWPVVEEQLEPLRSKNYLTYFNGSSLIKGPIIVVATGNAPFHKVVANFTYRDIFFDAPLPELAKLASTVQSSSSSTLSSTDYDSVSEKAYLENVTANLDFDAATSNSEDTDKGQGYSGIIPSDPRIYTKYNSYYASSSLQASVGSPFPYFTSKQRQQIEAQIEGAHAQGLQVRYWDVPRWPVSWRHYLWRELIQMGIDYLNVDDLLDATKGDWLSKGSIAKLIWGSGGW